MNLAAHESVLTVLAVLGPLLAVPTALVILYLKTLRDQQQTRHTDLVRRVDRLEQSLLAVRALLRDIERDYATKEEWLRECMWTRSRLDRLMRVGTATRPRPPGVAMTTSLADAVLSPADAGGADPCRNPAQG